MSWGRIYGYSAGSVGQGNRWLALIGMDQAFILPDRTTSLSRHIPNHI